MKFQLLGRSYVAMVALMFSVEVTQANGLTVGDAYARGSADGLVWTIGTKAIEMTVDGRGGAFRMVSLLNKACEPPLEYVDAKSAAVALCIGIGGQERQPMDAAIRLPRERSRPVGGRPFSWTWC